MKKKDPEPSEMTFFEHIDALRPHLVRGVMAIGVIGLVAFFCKSFIIDTVLFGPQSPDFPTNRMLTWVGTQWAHIAEWINGIDSEELRFLRRIATPSHIPPEPLTTIGATARLMWEEFNAKSEI